MKPINFEHLMREQFLKAWRRQPSATLHWMLPKYNEGFWQMRKGNKVVMDNIPMEIGDWVWREKKLAKDVFPDPHARVCNWHLVLK